MKILVVIPCLNEAATICEVIADVPKKLIGFDTVNVLVVDDGSTDQTSILAERAGALILRHPINRGVGAAFQSAVSYAIENNYNLMVNIDGDRQFNPADIATLIAPIQNGQADMVTASRFIDPSLVPNMPFIKLHGNHLMARLISSLVGQRFYDVSCGFRGYTRESLLLLNLHGAFTYTQETFLDFATKRVTIKEVPIVVKYFPDRKSRVAGSIIKYAVSTSKIIFRGYRDYFPLKFFSTIAACSAIPGTAFSLVFFIHYILTARFTGYLFAGFLGAFFYTLAAMFLLIGIVADMLDRQRLNQERILYMLKKLNSEQNKSIKF